MPLTPLEAAAAGIVLDASGTGSRRLYLLTVGGKTTPFKRREDRDRRAIGAYGRWRRLEQARTAEGLDMIQVFAQESAKYALSVAAAGGHTVMLYGPEGSARQMLRERMASIGGTVEQVRIGAAPDGEADIIVDMRPTDPADMDWPCPAETSAVIAAQVAVAKERVDGLSFDPAALDLVEECGRLLNLASTMRLKAVARTVAAVHGQGAVIRTCDVGIAASLCIPPRAA